MPVLSTTIQTRSYDIVQAAGPQVGIGANVSEVEVLNSNTGQ
jgi:hypothetical protein